MTGKFTMLAGFLGHRCGNNITTRDLLRYLEYLLTRFQAGEIKSKTVEDHVSAIRAVFKLAKQKKLLTTNPADDDGFKWRGKTQEKDKRAILTQKEQRLIIISTQHAKPIVQWGHWLGFMGLIVEEFADANVQDVYEDPDTGIWIFDIREDHREGNNRLKVDSRVRRVPLHKAVIEAGFLGYHGNIRKLDPTGPLFPDVSMDKYGRRAVRASRLIMKSIRLLGANLPSLKDRRKVHYSWRHTAITNFDARDDVNVDRARYLMGHDPLDDHAAHYIRRTIITSKETIDKLPSPI
jgi:integrase